ncbi:unnamed protein product, partial [Ectocarpus sp. 4 AP-2014]
PTVDRLGKSRQQSSRAAFSAGGAGGGGGGGGGPIAATPPPLDGPRPRPQTTVPIPGETAERYRSHRSGYSSASPSPHAPRRGALLSLGQEDSGEVGRAWNRNSNYFLHQNHDDQKNQAGWRAAESRPLTVRSTGNGDGSGRGGGGGGGGDSKSSGRRRSAAACHCDEFWS